jgi:hypothetical protein
MYVIELKMLAIISVTNLNDFQTHIFLFSKIASVLQRTVNVLDAFKNVIIIGIGVDHLATLPARPKPDRPLITLSPRPV